MNKLSWSNRLSIALRFIKLYIQRCQQDQIGMIGGYLAYISLLSVVPLIAVMFSMLSAFPMFGEFRQAIEAFVYANVIPSRGEEIQTYINQFIGNTGGMTAIGITALVVVALLLIHNIDKTLNKIWRVSKRPRPVISFSIYWMILTLGPILFGSSIAVTSYLIRLTRFAEGYTPGLSTLLLGVVPYLMSLLAFFLLYLVVPNIKVRSRHAFFGALLAMILFELSKRGFALYVTHFPAYDTIYGALALVPIVFVWVYLCWLVVLLGAELTALLQQIAADTEKADSDDPDQNNPDDESEVVV
ncbi:virulence factor BrkB family protein [Rheinheimera sp.]|uniref:virulence factor BrkB family protein n=1 Tax=Rheinheimera sp. TaxID=1869214 RepID=UPI00273662F8|nr:virulence factor BrkB family protein [Rheinheimera sp.]MDP2714920.1 virulence factor BrkB family protein [Rheinheimera sp.]